MYRLVALHRHRKVMDNDHTIWQLLPEQGGLFEWQKLREHFATDSIRGPGCVQYPVSENPGPRYPRSRMGSFPGSPVSVAPVAIEFLTLNEAVEWAFCAPPCIGPLAASMAAGASNAVETESARTGGTQIFIGDLSGSVTEQDLVACFSNYGPVRSAYIKRDSVSGKCIGFGFVEFQNGDDAERARVFAHRLRVCSRRIRVGPAYHRRNGYEVVAYRPPADMTTETLHRMLAQNFGRYAFDPNGTFVLDPSRLGPLWLQTDRVARIRFRQSWVADLIVQAGWIEWHTGSRSPAEAADAYAICRNGIEIQFRTDALPAEQAMRQCFEGFGAPLQDVLFVARKRVAYVIYEASNRGMNAALAAMRRVHAISAIQVWCHHCKVSAEFLLAYGMAVADWELRQSGVIASDSPIVYVGCPAKLPDLLVDLPY
jgi:hypothetical protein